MCLLRKFLFACMCTHTHIYIHIFQNKWRCVFQSVTNRFVIFFSWLISIIYLQYFLFFMICCYNSLSFQLFNFFLINYEYFTYFMCVVTVGLFSNFVCLTIFHIKNNFCYIVLKINLYTFYILSNLKIPNTMLYLLLLLLLSRFSHVQLCVTPQTAAHQAPLSLGFSRQKHWSGLPFPSPMHESEKWKWSRSVVSDPQQPHGLQPTRFLRPWDFAGKSTGVGCHCLLRCYTYTAWFLTLLIALSFKIITCHF